jgi:alkaline phosphatase
LIKDRKGSAFYAAELRKSEAYTANPETMLELLNDATADEQTAAKELIAKNGPKLPEEFAALLQSQRDKRFGVAWGTKTHAPSPVPVLAIGRGTEVFEGEYENTEIPRKLFKLMGLIDPTE